MTAPNHLLDLLLASRFLQGFPGNTPRARVQMWGEGPDAVRPQHQHFGLENWSGLPFPSPEDLPDPGIKPGSPKLQADSLLTE